MQSNKEGVLKQKLKWDQVLAFLSTHKQELEKMEQNCGERKKKLEVG